MIASRNERGIALIVTIMALLLMSALTAALVLTSTSETIIAAHFRSQIEGRYAAEAVIARAIEDLASAGDWTPVIEGSLRSPWVDGPSSGTRTLSDGSTIDLVQALNLANCEKSTACSQADLAAVTPDRPWGANNPHWTPYAFGPLRDLRAGGAIDSPYYVLLLAGNGPVPPLLAMRAEAFGPRGAHAVIEVTAGYNDDPGQGAVKILSWREVR